MDPANRSASAMVLSRVEQNDPDLTNLKVSNMGHFTREGMGNYWPNDSDNLARLCDAIGANTNYGSWTFTVLMNWQVWQLTMGCFPRDLSKMFPSMNYGWQIAIFLQGWGVKS